jgi:hypothetical protein
VVRPTRSSVGSVEPVGTGLCSAMEEENVWATRGVFVVRAGGG